MGKIHWYKRDPVAWLHGTRKLTLEERGAYADVIELIMSHDGRLEDDDEHIAGWLRCHLRKWRTIRSRLIDAGKLYVSDGFLHNNRCDKEALSALKFIETCSKGGRNSSETRRQKQEKSTTYEEPHYSKPDEVITTTTTNKISPPLSPSSEGEQPPKKSRAKPRFRMPADAKPSEIGRLYAIANGVRPTEVDFLWERFHSYHCGKGTMIADIEGYWRTWVLNEKKFAKPDTPNPPAVRSGYGYGM